VRPQHVYTETIFKLQADLGVNEKYFCCGNDAALMGL
jgi:hypothetical protein